MASLCFLDCSTNITLSAPYCENSKRECMHVIPCESGRELRELLHIRMMCLEIASFSLLFLTTMTITSGQISFAMTSATGMHVSSHRIVPFSLKCSHREQYTWLNTTSSSFLSREIVIFKAFEPMIQVDSIFESVLQVQLLL